MNKETAIMHRIMLALSEAGCTVWRNETAGAWVGRVIHKDGHQVTLSGARLIRFGVATGSSDIIGIMPTVITPDMVGQTLGVFLAVEVKTATGRATKEQLQFIESVQRAGGVAGIARCPADALQLIGG